jgi:transglutaminase-like putative cysteine protease
MLRNDAYWFSRVGHAIERADNTARLLDVKYKDATHVATTAAEAFDKKSGVCQDFAHLFIACARELSIPARYVSGYFLRSDGEGHQPASHAWAEAHVDDLGWVGFDPAHGLSPDDAYVRVAAALDYLGAAPVRGARADAHADFESFAAAAGMARIRETGVKHAP